MSETDKPSAITEITMDEIKRRYRAAFPRGHWFDPDTMRFFESKLPRKGFEGPGGVFFVSSEKNCFDDYTRVFTVRQLSSRGIDTIGEKSTDKEAQDTRAFYYAINGPPKEK